MNWHTMSVEDAFTFLKTSYKGITQEEAQVRLNAYGFNELKEKKKMTPLMMLLHQFTDFMILVLIAAALLSGLLGELSDTIAIIVIVVLNAIIGFVQEYRAEKAMEALKKMAAPLATVIREGTPVNIPAREIVPGDIVLLEAGKIIPADLRLIEAAQLKIEEAALTGESVPVEKQTQQINEENLPLGDRKNMAYNGTIVTYGRGSGIAVATGMNTELGKIATMLQEEEEVKTPLQKRLAVFGKKLSIAVLVLCAVIFGIGLLRGEEPLRMLLTAISLAVAAIPEALPAVITISLALGARKMVNQNALIRKLPAVETLGSVTYICSDKTGTLTQNKMTVETIFVNNTMFTATQPLQDNRSKSSQLFFYALALNNDAIRDTSGTLLGDPTETALYYYAFTNSFDKDLLTRTFPRVAEIPFDSERKCMTTIHKNTNQEITQSPYIVFTKGAVDTIIDSANTIMIHSEIVPINKDEILKVAEQLSEQGLRVLAVTSKFLDTLPSSITPETVESNLTFLGLVGMIDPPRQEVQEAVSECKSAGIKPVMITGDHPLTAKAIAKRLGIIDENRPYIITGKELQELSLEEFEQKVEYISVYARVAPEQKLKIVKALQDKGQFVAMTGDGVNDAPALKRADIGVAMGITGTDVSKQAAHMILLDDNFATIVKAVREGRRIFDNIRKFIKYTMTSNSGEIWTIFLAPFFGLPIPLLPIHILWINLVTDGLPGLALASEPEEKGIMQRPPRHPQESIFAHGLGAHIIWVGLLMGAVSIITQALSITLWNAHWQTMVFTVLCLSQMGHVLAIRSEKQSLFTLGLFSNKPLLGAFILTFVLQMATIYVPYLNGIFKTHPLTLEELSITLALSSVIFIAVEIEKFLKRKK
ncbi:MAG TPA: cation-translocating P-type ATPase [Spirochaetota bacterium]|nr:cation-translocating P-type ATPase [Spirochaetota bacterium]HOM08619.1 cation-translocating P-type ATPase [Spirochaetota bacterium]HPP48438.1 cation-translocating P-type ATPase [Spirochaetota bacterium]